MITIEGPRFSTRAESKLYRSWNCDVINMTVVPECILARELGIHYASIAMVTDFDCWKLKEKPVTVDEIMKTINKNTENAKILIENFINQINHYNTCPCENSHKYSKL